MIEYTERALGPAGYDFGDAHKLPEKLENKELFNEPSWRIAMEILRGSFVISSGRQYAQLCDMAVAAALIDEQKVQFDRSIFTDPDATEAIREWELPPSHTGKPTHTPNLVKGGHDFWWRMLGDTFAWRFEGAELLPNERAIIERFRECGVPFGRTSSTTTEEIAALDKAVDDLRSARGETSDELAMRSLKWHLRAGLHWLSHKRPRTDHGDKHEVRWLTGMLAALATPENQRNTYDQVLIKEAEALDTLLAMPGNVLAAHGLEDTRELYDEVLDLYNHVHEEEQRSVLHRLESSEGRNEPVPPTASTLGTVSVMYAVVPMQPSIEKA